MPARSSTILALLAAAALVLAGCGVSSPTKAQYTARADAICRSASAQTAPLIAQLASAAASLSSGGQSAAKEMLSALQQLHAVASNSLEELRALKQPSAGHAAIERFLTPFASVVGALAQAADDAAAGEVQQALTQLEQAAPAATQTASAAGAYGLSECQTVLAPLSSTAYAVHATLVGENHEPIVNQPWRYTVTVTDVQGRKLSGTETTQYTYGGAVVGTEKPENVPFSGGVYHDTIEFPAEAVGYPLDVQTVIHTTLGSVTLDWPVVVRR